MSTYFELDERLRRFRKHPATAGGKPARKSANAPAASRVNGTAPAAVKPKAASIAARAFNAPVSYRVPGIVPPERQVGNMTCWAAVTTMMTEWRDNQTMSTETVLGNLGGVWLAKYRANQGLLPSEKGDFLATAGLMAEPSMNYSIEGWLQLLRTYGPLWVTTQEDPSNIFSIHARIIVAIEGDGTPDGTSFRIVDPASATEYSQTVTAFTTSFEAEASDSSRALRIQVVHWPANAQSAAAGASAPQSRTVRAFSRPRTRAFTDGDAGAAAAGSLAWGARVAPDFRTRVREIAGGLACNADHLMSAMAFETGETFSPSIRNNASGATGLIQFMPSTARNLGTTTDDLAAMSAVQQLDYVERYFRPYANRMGTLEDVYMAILWPRAVGQANNTVLFSQPSRAYDLNRGLDANGDGSVTKDEAAAPVRRKLSRGQLPENAA